jgi:hypothetical protein
VIEETMATNRNDDHERAAAGMDYDNPLRDKATNLGDAIAEEGPEALFDELENLLPESWREHIQAFPIAALILGIGVGIWLGLKKGDEIISSGSSMLTTAAMSNISSIMDRATGGA